MEKGDIRIAALKPTQIFLNLRRYAPFSMFAAFVGWVILVGMIFALFREAVPLGTARAVAITGATVIVAAVSFAMVAWMCRDYAQCKLEIRGNRLIVAAPSPGRIEERWFDIPAIQEFTLGQSPNLFQEFTSAGSFLTGGTQSALLSGKLTIVTNDFSAVFGSIDVVFDQASISAIVNELANRGVKINRFD